MSLIDGLVLAMRRVNRGPVVVDWCASAPQAATALMATCNELQALEFEQTAAGRDEGLQGERLPDARHVDFEHRDGHMARVTMLPEPASWAVTVEFMHYEEMLQTEVRCADGGWRRMKDILNVPPAAWPPPVYS